MEYKETKANKAISFWHFIQEHTVEIPIIQRDYAQGRLGEEYLRYNFLTNLKQALDGELPNGSKVLTLDFVYGAQNKEESKLYPLDGQQRLTTLWLFHWYIALKAGTLEKVCGTLKNFSYETRISSREFCQELCNYSHFQKYDNAGSIVDFITSRTWFYAFWKQDPTIQAMLRMIGGTKINNKYGQDIVDGLEELFQGTSGETFKCYWEALTSDAAPIVFYHLPLENFGLTDDLYIKMNARGKQLTSFENFKADLIGYIMKEKWDDLLDPQNGIPQKLDTNWTDVFWEYRNEKECRIDEIYFAFLNRYFLNAAIVYANADESHKEWRLYGKDSDDNAVSYYGDFETYSSFLSEKMLKKLITIFDNMAKSGKKINDAISGGLPLWFNKSSNQFYLIPKYYKDGKISKLTRPQRAVFWGLCKFFEQYKLNEDTFTCFKRWMRVVCNLVENTTIGSIDAMIARMKLIDELSSHIEDIYEYLSSENLKIKSKASPEQLAEETEKAKQILKKDYSGNIEEFNGKTWEDVISEAEKYAFFKGAIRFLFLNNSGEWDWSDFDTKWKNLKKSVTSTKEDRNVIYHMISFFNDKDIKTIFTGYDLSNDDNNLRGIFVKYASKMHNFLMNENSSQELSLLQTDLRALCEKYPTFWIHKQWMCGMDVLSNYAYRSGDYSSRSFFIGTSFIRERLAFLKEINGVTINGQQSNWLDNESMPPKGLHISFEYKTGNTSYSFKWQSWNWIDMYDGDKRLCKDERLKTHDLTIDGSKIKDKNDLIVKMNQCIGRYRDAKKHIDQQN